MKKQNTIDELDDSSNNNVFTKSVCSDNSHLKKQNNNELISNTMMTKQQPKNLGILDFNYNIPNIYSKQSIPTKQHDNNNEYNNQNSNRRILLEKKDFEHEIDYSKDLNNALLSQNNPMNLHSREHSEVNVFEKNNKEDNTQLQPQNITGNVNNINNNRFTNDHYEKERLLSNDQTNEVTSKYIGQLKLANNTLLEEVGFWRGLFVNQVKESLEFETTIKCLYEENRLNQEYIISLEDRINKLLIRTNNITNNYHNNLKSLHRLIQNIESTSNENNKILNNLDNIFNQMNLIDDFKSQLEILSEEKENSNSNLALSRHQYLQASIKLDQFQKKIVDLHQNMANLKEHYLKLSLY